MAGKAAGNAYSANGPAGGMIMVANNSETLE